MQRKRNGRKNESNIPFYLRRMKIQKCKENILRRKYGYIFLNKVYSKLTPSQAYKYYDMRLKKVAFLKWKHLWWCHRVEWRLYLRANCFYRIKMLRLTFRAWKLYTHKRFVSYQNRVKARNHYQDVLQRRAFRKLQHHSTIQKSEKNVLKIANRTVHLIITRKILLRCNDNIIRAKLSQTANALAARFRRYKVLKMTLHTWKQTTEIKKAKQYKLDIARKFSAARTLHMALRAWKRYIKMRETKKNVLNIAIAIHKEILLKQFINMWLKRLQSNIAEEKLLLEAGTYSERKLLEKTFRSWHSWLLYSERKRDLKCTSQNHWERHTKVKAFRQWKIFTEMKKEKALKNLEATDHYTAKILRSAWKIWILYVEEKENLRIIDKLQHADSFYRGKLLQKSIKGMKIHVNINKRKEMLKEKSKCILLINCIQVWWDEWQRVQHERKLETQAVAFYQMSCLRQTVQTWQKQSEKMKYLRELEDVASSHYKEKILHSCFWSWYCWVKGCLRRKILLIESECWNNERLLWRCFQQWRKFRVQKSEMRMKMLKAESKYNDVIKRRSLQIWKSFYSHQLLLQQQVELLLKTNEKKLMKNVLCGWQAVKTSRRYARHFLIHVMDLYLSHLVRLVLSHWLLYVEMRLNKQRRREKLVQPWREKMNTRVIPNECRVTIVAPVYKEKGDKHKMYVRRWHSNYTDLLLVNQRKEMAYSVYCRKLTARFFHAWVSSHILSQAWKDKKADLKQKMNTFICQRWCMEWHQQYQERNISRRNYLKALLFWSTELKSKCIRRWIQFVHMSRLDKDGYVRAQALYHRSLLKDGLSLWLLTAQVRAKQQENIALKLASTISRHEFQLAYKYFRRWRVNVLNKKLTLCQPQELQSKCVDKFQRNAVVVEEMRNGVPNKIEDYSKLSPFITTLPTRNVMNSAICRRSVTLNYEISASNRPKPRIPQSLELRVTQSQQWPARYRQMQLPSKTQILRKRHFTPVEENGKLLDNLRQNCLLPVALHRQDMSQTSTSSFSVQQYRTYEFIPETSFKNRMLLRNEYRHLCCQKMDKECSTEKCNTQNLQRPPNTDFIDPLVTSEGFHLNLSNHSEVDSLTCDTHRTYTVTNPVFIHPPFSNFKLLPPEYFQHLSDDTSKVNISSAGSLYSDSLDNEEVNRLQNRNVILLPPSVFEN